MKFLAIFSLLFSTFAMAVNQCKPDDICLSFKTSKGELSIACKNIESVEIATHIQENDSLGIRLKNNTELSDFSVKNIGQVADININGIKYTHAVITSRMDTSIRITITSNPNFQLVDDLIKCVN
ncbi:hypothetical protein [Proteus sp. ZN5]|uniref:hypothetical protein n=1 Tax=Proteus sp. ZN5 TaxID=2697019 RepID=UPI0013E1614F|nr:hypothetical protein [Proteus sp. ZN5]QIG05221.1 hypothetical protein GTK47_07700 [Proteus sp. ZN5]